MQDHIFNIFGYHVDYWVNGKYCGHVRIQKPDRKIMSYSGRITETLVEPVQTNKTTLPVGATVTHECIPLCGSIHGSTLEERIAVLADYHNSVPYKNRNK
jgi:hypothetical protein